MLQTIVTASPMYEVEAGENLETLNWLSCESLWRSALVAESIETAVKHDVCFCFVWSGGPVSGWTQPFSFIVSFRVFRVSASTTRWTSSLRNALARIRTVHLRKNLGLAYLVQMDWKLGCPSVRHKGQTHCSVSVSWQFTPAFLPATGPWEIWYSEMALEM